mmetsp:Transcript_21060/g.32140  ORF Transcript_21060/g.32140 Transcript_21060/m.32140 type:complete len:111 (+) Transcript_21060:176-508(+)
MHQNSITSHSVNEGDLEGDLLRAIGLGVELVLAEADTYRGDDQWRGPNYSPIIYTKIASFLQESIYKHRRHASGSFQIFLGWEDAFQSRMSVLCNRIKKIRNGCLSSLPS